MTKALLLAGTLSLLLLTGTNPAECQDCLTQGNPCWGYGCGENCICIQPEGPGSEGWCN